MKVAIDLTALLPEATGVDTYLRQLVIHLGQMDRRNRFTIFTNYEDRRLFGGLLPDNFTVATGSWRPRPARLFFQQLVLPTIGLVKGVDVIHSPSFIMPFYKGSPRHLLTIHDMTFFSLSDYHTALRRSSFYRHAVLHSIRRADAINAPSNATKQQIVELVPEIKPERIKVINWGIGSEFHPITSEEIEAVLTRLNLPRPYILYLGTIEPRKNLARLVESYRRILTSTGIPEHLVLVGKMGWGYDALLRQIDDPQLRGKVHLKGYVDQRDLPGLYCGARLFVYPSFYEGFGFPPLEAMACGVPVIASFSSALAENLEGAAELVSPTDLEELVEAMRRLLFNQPLRAQRQAQGLRRAAKFHWNEAARKTLECYNELAVSR